MGTPGKNQGEPLLLEGGEQFLLPSGPSVIGRGKIDEDGRIRDLLSEQACLEMIDFGRDCNIGRRKDIAAPHANFPHGNAEAIAKGGGG
tara:strand:- start:412 stop:678 length:267 start_codon:yes stop_codon:yes gene_type:complete